MIESELTAALAALIVQNTTLETITARIGHQQEATKEMFEAINSKEENSQRKIAEIIQSANNNINSLSEITRLLASTELSPLEEPIPILRAETDKDIEDIQPRTLSGTAKENEEPVDPDIAASHVVRRESETAGELITNNEN